MHPTFISYFGQSNQALGPRCTVRRISRQRLWAWLCSPRTSTGVRSSSDGAGKTAQHNGNVYDIQRAYSSRLEREESENVTGSEETLTKN